MLINVTAFNSETDMGRLDYQLMMRAPVRLLHSRVLLAETIEWLRQHAYEVVTVDASWLITSHMFRDMGTALEYVCHDQWHCLGEGLDEALSQVWKRSAGFALALTGFDVFVGQQIEDAHTLLEVVTERAWTAALRGKRLICIIQSDDRALQLRRIGMSTNPLFDHERTAWTTYLANHRPPEP